MIQTVLITGANGNLGTVVTQHFLSKGYMVIATVHNAEAKKEMTGHKNLSVFVVNLADEKETENFVADAIEKYKKIDAALLLAGGFAAGSLAETKIKNIKQQFSLNFETAYHVVQALYPQMLMHNNGRLVFIGARPALKASYGKNLIAYGLSKSLLFKLAEYINEDGKGKNITATVIVPGTIDTSANRKSMPDADPEKWVKPQAFAEMLEFIVSKKGDGLRENVLKMYGES